MVMKNGSKFNRYIKVKFGESEIVVEGLKMNFRIERFSSSLHTMQLDIYNLGNRKGEEEFLQVGKSIFLEAGYQNLKSTIFGGVINNTNIRRDGVDFITTIYCNDGRSFRDKIVKFSWSKSTSLDNVIQDIASQTGIKVVKNNIKSNNLQDSFEVSEQFHSIMDMLSSSYDFRWYLINGALHVFDSLKGNSEKELFEISALNGLLETPVLTANGGINIKMLLEPSISNGDLFDVRSQGLTLAQGNLEYSVKNTFGLGTQQVLDLAHTGDTHGDTWYTELFGVKSF